jgi:murein DD-endopeptidase MepM/ murein hydrolase activator NlpD
MFRLALAWGLGSLMLVSSVAAQTLYKFAGDDGVVVYTDRKPAASDDVEERALPLSRAGEVALEWHQDSGRLSLLARNSLHAPVQIRLLPDDTGSPGGFAGDWLVPAASSQELLTVESGTVAASAIKRQRYMWLYGDPRAQHKPQTPYRAPFPAAVSYPVSQSFPHTVTHTTPDSVHAIDIAMPVGSNVLAARDGIVVEVASTNFRSSLQPDQPGARANLIRVLHDDGTFAIYAHLNWNSIRVRPGDRVRRGEYIADSGNTGFSTGPHLHFVVLKNVGTRLESLPVRFATADGGEVAATTGGLLTAF